MANPIMMITKNRVPSMRKMKAKFVLAALNDFLLEGTRFHTRLYYSEGHYMINCQWNYLLDIE